jgi:hypothetical protein
MASNERGNGNVPGHWSGQPNRPVGAIVLWVAAIVLTAIGVMQIPGLYG